MRQPSGITLRRSTGALFLAGAVLLSLIGFLRWVFVVPALAQTYLAGDAATKAAVDAAGSTGWGLWVAVLGLALLLTPGRPAADRLLATDNHSTRRAADPDQDAAALPG